MTVAGLHYLKHSFSIFPVRGKLPPIPWAEFQHRRPMPTEVRVWWRLWRSAGIAIACGAPEVGGMAAIPARRLRQLVRARAGVHPVPQEDGTVRWLGRQCNSP